jgi:hypothetical protein
MHSCGGAFRVIEKCVASDQIVIDAGDQRIGTDSARPPYQDPKPESSEPQMPSEVWRRG